MSIGEISNLTLFFNCGICKMPAYKLDYVRNERAVRL